MKKSTAGILSFGIILFILYVFGIQFYESVWSFPGGEIHTEPRAIPLMIIALIGTGVFVTIFLGFPQIRYLWHGIKVTMGKYDDPNDEGDLNHFRALTTALSATVGIGDGVVLWRSGCAVLDVDNCVFRNNIEICRIDTFAEISRNP